MFPAKFKKLLEGDSHDIIPANKETNPRRMVTKLDQSCLHTAFVAVEKDVGAG